MISEAVMPDTETEIARDKKINLMAVAQRWLVLIASFIAIAGAMTAWLGGWIGLPEKVAKIEECQKILMFMSNRVDALEKVQVTYVQRSAVDHDILITISQSLIDLKEQNKELRDDVKNLKKSP